VAGSVSHLNFLRNQHAGDERSRTLAKAKTLPPDVPVIMITAYGDAETRRKAIERGAVGLLTKPIDFALVRHEIDTRLGQAA
jgi:DNA-binding NtrC family response regulator